MFPPRVTYVVSLPLTYVAGGEFGRPTADDMRDHIADRYDTDVQVERLWPDTPALMHSMRIP